MSGIKIIQIGMDEALEIQKKSNDEKYDAFVDKFKPKLTTDDCYTPTIVFDAIKDWVCNRYGVDPDKTLRPFRPGGDYERFDYPEGCAVVDNPPFSILSKIIAYYARRDIPFFLFAPALTLFSSSSSSSSATCIPCGVSITYENGAQVPTSFVTNMDDRSTRVRTAPALYKAVKAADDRNRKDKAKSLPKYEYPDHIITAAMVQRWCKYGVDYRLTVADSRPIDALDAQRARKLSIFGNGFILSSRAAAERWKLSERELEIVRYIDKHLPD